MKKLTHELSIFVGIAVRGLPGYVVNRPHGSGDWVLVHFLAPARLERGGAPVETGTCILYRPSCPTYIEAPDGVIVNDFLHFSPSLLNQAARFGLPCNQPFFPCATSFIQPLLEKIQEEWVGRETHWEQAIRLHLTELLLQLSRALPSQENAPTPHAATLREVRLKVHNRVQHPWTVREMCELAGLRETQFSRLYQQLFDCSPMEDLIRARLETAQFYLTNSTLNISAVAEVSGFFNPYYFSRYFRQRTGLAPQEYRRKYRL